jgi:sugar lactone lactonase YvrE
MSLDRRLREGLIRSAGAVHEGRLDDVFDGIVGGARRRRRVRRTVGTAIAIALGVMAMLVTPKALDALRGFDDPIPALPQDVGTIVTVAGTGIDGITGDGGPATDAGIGYPIDVALDADGNLYILQYFPGWVRKVDRAGRITTVYVERATGEADDDDPTFPFSASGMAVDAAGTVYVALDDPVANRVIRIDRDGRVTTVAGTGEAGFSGDGGPATQAQLQAIWDVAVDAEGNLYISTDNRIRKVDTAGVITTIAGTGEPGYSGDGGPAVDALLAGPVGVAVDATGNVYFVDNLNDRIRRIDRQGVITTIAGPGPSEGCVASGDGGPAVQADFCDAGNLTIDAAGNIFFADTGNHRIRRIDTSGIITTVAGTGTPGFSGDGDPGVDARLSEPSAVAVGLDGALYIADSGNHRLRRVLV